MRQLSSGTFLPRLCGINCAVCRVRGKEKLPAWTDICVLQLGQLTGCLRVCAGVAPVQLQYSLILLFCCFCVLNLATQASSKVTERKKQGFWRTFWQGRPVQRVYKIWGLMRWIKSLFVHLWLLLAWCPHKDDSLSSNGKNKRGSPLQTETSCACLFTVFNFRGKKNGGKKLQLGLHRGSDFPFLRVALKHTAYFLFGLAGGSRATATALSEPITLTKKRSGSQNSSTRHGREWTFCCTIY